MHRFIGMALAGLLVLGCGEHWHREEADWHLLADSSGRTLEVQAVFGGSSCTNFIEWHVDEGADVVDVRAVIERSNARDCTADDVLVAGTIELESPLGDRRLVGCDPSDRQAECQ